jgi:hypothetical protein
LKILTILDVPASELLEQDFHTFREVVLDPELEQLLKKTGIN